MTGVSKFIEFYNTKLGNKILELEVEAIRQELNGTDRIIDVGCGIGIFEEKLPEYNIIGVDYSKQMLNEAVKRQRHFATADAEALPFKNSSFNFAFAVTSLEFIDNIKLALSEILRILSQDARIFVLMLNNKSDYFRKRSDKKDSYFNQIVHRNPLKLVKALSNYFEIEWKYFLGIKDGKITEKIADEKTASLIMIRGRKK